MKLSDFLKDRELEFFTNDKGKEDTRIVEPITKGKIKFHIISKELLDNLNSSGIKQEKEYNEITYKIMDILTDIKKDVPLEKFKSMLAYPPNDAFIIFIEQINKEFIGLMNRFTKFKDSINKVNQEINKKIEDMPQNMKEEFKKAQLTPEELLQNLKKEYDSAEDEKEKDKILDKIIDLKATIKNKK